MAIYRIKLEGRQEIASDARDPDFTFAARRWRWGNRQDLEWRERLPHVMPMKSVHDLSLPIFYVAGPPAVVAAMRKILDDSGVKDDKIRTDEFSGY